MVNSTNQNSQHGLESFEGTSVARSLNELPDTQRQKITRELKRIHKIVSALDIEEQRDTRQDKADKA
jgi:hypothetical protein